MGGDPLVELDEFIDLGAGQRAAFLDQLVEPVPRTAMGQHECVDVHPAQPNRISGAAGSGPVAPRKPVPFGVMSEVVTGDAVVLDVQIAQLPVRVVGALIDITVIFVCYVLGLMLWAATLTGFDSALSTAVLLVFTVLVIVGYPLAFETATRGRSVGKFVMGLRVVSDDGGPERFRQALFRALASVVEIWMLAGSPPSSAASCRRRPKRLGDIFAGTVVVSERGPRLGPPPAMPLRWHGGRPRCSCPDWTRARPKSRANSFPAHHNSITI